MMSQPGGGQWAVLPEMVCFSFFICINLVGNAVGKLLFQAPKTSKNPCDFGSRPHGVGCGFASEIPGSFLVVRLQELKQIGSFLRMGLGKKGMEGACYRYMSVFFG